MIRPFRLRDSYLLNKLARQSVSLNLERHLTHPLRPLWAALGSPVPWYGSGVATFVSLPDRDQELPAGYIQASKRLGQSEADVCSIAPRLEKDAHVHDAWQALLRHLITHAGDFGIQRLYACLPAQEEAAHIVASSGFARYARETLYQLHPASVTPPAVAASPHVRSQREIDSLALQRLYYRHTPRVVQQAEGLLLKENETSNIHLIFQDWLQPSGANGLVYEQKGEILGAVRFISGGKGRWLHFWGDPTQQEVLDALLTESIRLAAEDRLPLYCGVRSYQSALGAALSAKEFQPSIELARLVKHTTVRIREPAASRSRILVETTLPGVLPSQNRPEPKRR